MTDIGGSILIGSLAYGVLTGIAFFVYLFWFRHVRDNTESRGLRILYYFLISLSFVVLAELAGVSVIFGVLPMLVILHFLPKEGYKAIAGCALAFAALSFGIAHRQARQQTPRGTTEFLAAGRAITEDDPKDYFTAQSVLPDAEFEPAVNGKIGNIEVLIPIPKDIAYTYSIEHDDKKRRELYTYLFSKEERQVFLCFFQDIRKVDAPNKELTKEKANLRYRMVSEQYKKDLIEMFSDKWKCTIHDAPKVIQNTTESFVVLSELQLMPLDQIDSSRFAIMAIFDGGLIIDGNYIGFLAFASGTLPQPTDASLFITWLNNILYHNRIERSK